MTILHIIKSLGRGGAEMLLPETIRVHNKDEFKFHVDVQDYASARRFLVYFWYLNTVEEGGETCFQLNRQHEIEVKVQPQTGRLLMFPPMWTHPHVALPPISGPKYIMSAYLHYK